MKGNTRMVNKMEKEYIILLMLNTLDSGWMISSMAMGKKFGIMDQGILEITLRVKNKEKEYCFGAIDLNLKESSIRVMYME